MSTKGSDNHLLDGKEQAIDIFDAMGDALFSLDNESRVIFANKGVGRLLERDVNELIGKNIAELIPLRGGWMFYRYLEMAHSEKRYVKFDHFKFADKRFEVYFYPVRNGVAVFLHDITTKWQTEELYRLALFMLDRLNEVVFLVRFDGRLFHVNDETGRLLGYTRDELIHMKIFDVDTSLTAEGWQDEFNTIKGKKQAVFESEYKARDGMLIPVEINVNFIELYGNEYYCVTARDITERKKAEALNSRLAAIVESSEDAIISKTLDGVITSWNAGAERIFGYTAEEIIGKSKSILIPSDHADELAYTLNKIKNGERIVHYETVRMRKNGKRIDVSLSASPILNESGCVIGVSNILRDITERKRAEEVLRQRESSLSLAQHMSRIGSWSYDVKNDSVYWSDEMCHMMGIPLDRRYMTFSELLKYIHPDDMDKFKEQNDRMFRDNIPFNADFRFIRPDGKIIFVHSECTIEYDEEGNPTWLNGFGQDITERKAIEESLRKLSRVVEEGPGVVVITDVKGNIEYVNYKFTELTGYSFDEARGKNPNILKSGDTPPEEYKRLWDSVLSGNEWRGEFHNKKKNGELYWESAIISPFKDKDGKITHFIAIKEDITERKQNELELQKAKSLVEMYNDLLGHDINNMNQVGIGYLELAINSPELNEESKKLLSKPLEALINSSMLIENVRKLQSIKSGVTHKVTDINQVLLEVINSYSDVKDSRAIINYSPISRCMVMANELLRDVFSNLIGNAIKHTNGNIEVDIGASCSFENGVKYCKVYVEDNGPGIPDKVKNTLFTRFQRGDTKASGKGLGLFIVKTLVEDYSGRVWVEDRVAGDHTKGSRFVVLLPAIEK
jgi:PAS domain S-box-containing protein